MEFDNKKQIDLSSLRLDDREFSFETGSSLSALSLLALHV